MLPQAKALVDVTANAKHEAAKRFPNYRQVLCKISQPVIMVSLLNIIRVAGALLLLQDALCLIYAMGYYATKCAAFENKCPSHVKWRQPTQFEAVIRPAVVLCFYSLGDRVVIAAEMALTLLKFKMDYEYDDVYDVVDIDSIDKWTASI